MGRNIDWRGEIHRGILRESHEIFLRPGKTKVWNFSCEGQNDVFIAPSLIVNFLGEFPNADFLISAGARVGGFLSIFVGTGVIAVPTGLIGSALEDIFNDSTEGGSDGGGSGDGGSSRGSGGGSGGGAPSDLESDASEEDDSKKKRKKKKSGELRSVDDERNPLLAREGAHKAADARAGGPAARGSARNSQTEPGHGGKHHQDKRRHHAMEKHLEKQLMNSSQIQASHFAVKSTS